MDAVSGFGVESMQWNRSMHADVLAEVEDYPATSPKASDLNPDALAEVRAKLQSVVEARRAGNTERSED